MIAILGLSVIGGFFATLGRLIDPQRFLSLGSGAQEIGKLREELAHRVHHAKDQPGEVSQAETDQP